jgi:hypothetical protein
MIGKAGMTGGALALLSLSGRVVDEGPFCRGRVSAPADEFAFERAPLEVMAENFPKPFLAFNRTRTTAAQGFANTTQVE